MRYAMDSFLENYPSTFGLKPRLLGSGIYTSRSRVVMPNLSATETLKRPTRGRTIHVYLLQHAEKTVFVAISAELSGLVVHGHSPEEIEGRLAGVIQDILEADGYEVQSVTVERDERLAKAGFALPPYIANASLTAIQQ
jgi:hypothetical protein